MGISLDEVILDASTSNVAISDGTNTLGVNANGSLDVEFAAGAQIEITDGVETLLINGDGSINAVVTATDLDVRNLVFATDKVDVSASVIALDAATLAALETTTVVATDLDIRNLVFATDKVDVSGSTLTGITNDVNIADGGNSITVDAVDLDVRDLTHVSDSVKIGDGTDLLAVNADGSINVNLTDDGIADGAADSGNPFKVGSRAHDGVLTAVDDGDRADLLSDLYRRVWVNDSANIAIKNSVETVSVVAEVLATPLAGRRSVTIQNEGSQSVYIGSSASVTSANGIKIGKNSSATFEWGEDIDIFMIAASGSQSVRFLESA